MYQQFSVSFPDLLVVFIDVLTVSGVCVCCCSRRIAMIQENTALLHSELRRLQESRRERRAPACQLLPPPGKIPGRNAPWFKTAQLGRTSLTEFITYLSILPNQQSFYYNCKSYECLKPLQVQLWFLNVRGLFYSIRMDVCDYSKYKNIKYKICDSCSEVVKKWFLI